MVCNAHLIYKLLTTLFLISGSIVFFISYDTLENTSYNIASRHMTALHNYACKIKTTERVYVVVKDSGNVVNQTRYADLVIGYIAGDSAIVSTSFAFVTANQYFQYIGRMPQENQYGLYFDVCVQGDANYNEASGRLTAICYTVLFAMFWALVLLLAFTDCLCATMCRRGRYEEIN